MYKLRLSRKATNTLAWLLIILGIAGVGASIFIYSKQAKPPAKAKSVSVQVAPSATKPSTQSIATYTVAPTLPKFIAIPAINISQARVIQLGLKNGAIATPGNIYDAGWYNGSSKPGQSGAMFIYGHVSSWQANGLFYNLKKLKPGDTVTITRGDNAVFNYQVVSTKIYDYQKVDMNAVLAPINPHASGLNLMTCTGQVIKGTSEFNQRLVVFTKPVG